MNEKVVVNQDIPEYLPNFKNPIFEFTEKARLLAIEEIKTGYMPEGLYAYKKIIKEFDYLEKRQIIACWREHSITNPFFYRILGWYYCNVLGNDWDRIQEMDKDYLTELARINGKIGKSR